jgi:hypothetical protein
MWHARSACETAEDLLNLCRKTRSSRRGLTVKLMKLQLQGPSLAPVSFKALGGALNKYLLSSSNFVFVTFILFHKEDPRNL